MKPLDISKPVITRNGYKARILCTDYKGVNGETIVAAIERRNLEFARSYYKSGRYFPDQSTQSDHDLINAPEPPKWRAWEPREVPIGAIVRNKSTGDWATVSAVVGGSVKLGLLNSFNYNPFESFRQKQEDYEYTTDNGKTWLTCGVLENAQ